MLLQILHTSKSFEDSAQWIHSTLWRSSRKMKVVLSSSKSKPPEVPLIPRSMTKRLVHHSEAAFFTSWWELPNILDSSAVLQEWHLWAVLGIHGQGSVGFHWTECDYWTSEGHVYSNWFERQCVHVLCSVLTNLRSDCVLIPLSPELAWLGSSLVESPTWYFRPGHMNDPCIQVVDAPFMEQQLFWQLWESSFRSYLLGE